MAYGEPAALKPLSCNLTIHSTSSVSEVDSLSLKVCTRWRTFWIVEVGDGGARSGIVVVNVGPGDGAGRCYRDLQSAGGNLEGVVGQI